MQRNHTPRLIEEAENKMSNNANPLNDLTRFQMDLLVAVGRLSSNQAVPIGLDLKRFLDHSYVDEEIHHGRLYPNLETLEDKGLIRREDRDQRSQTVELTDQGKRALEARQAWTHFDIPGDSGGG